jgi:hypothetical protein
MTGESAGSAAFSLRRRSLGTLAARRSGSRFAKSRPPLRWGVPWSGKPAMRLPLRLASPRSPRSTPFFASRVTAEPIDRVLQSPSAP